jgi:hypothetical protein
LILPFPAHSTRLLITTVVVALVATPIWLGPVAELSGNSGWVTNLVVAVSPLSAFSVALDFDFLRTNWFYQHSALGSLRYAYASWFVYVAGLAAASILFIVSANLFSTSRVKT